MFKHTSMDDKHISNVWLNHLYEDQYPITGYIHNRASERRVSHARETTKYLTCPQKSAASPPPYNQQSTSVAP